MMHVRQNVLVAVNARAVLEQHFQRGVADVIAVGVGDEHAADVRCVFVEQGVTFFLRFDPAVDQQGRVAGA